MGRCKSLGSLKSFLWYASRLYGASILCFQILSFLKLHLHWWPCSDDCLMMDTPCFHPEFSPGSLWGGVAVTDGCDILGFWYGRQCFISHNSSHVLGTFALLPTTSAALVPALQDHCHSLNLISFSAKASAPPLQPAPMFKAGKNEASVQKFLIKHQSYSAWNNLDHVPTSEPTTVAGESQYIDREVRSWDQISMLLNFQL